jgi:hypothetical protein
MLAWDSEARSVSHEAKLARTQASRTTSGVPVIPGRESTRAHRGLFDQRPADSAERIEPPMRALALVEEVPDSLFDQFMWALIAPASEFLLDLLVKSDGSVKPSEDCQPSRGQQSCS